MSALPADIPGLGATTQKLRASPAFDPMAAGIGPEEYFVLSRIDGQTSIRDLLQMTGFAVDRGVQILVRLRELGAVLLPGEPVPARPAAKPSGRATPPGGTPAIGRTPTPGVARTVTPPQVSRTMTPQPQVSRTMTPPPQAASRTRSGTGPTVSRTATSEAPRSQVLRPMAPPASAPAVAPPPAAAVALDAPTAAEKAALAEDVELSLEERRDILLAARRVATGDALAMLGLAAGADKRAIKRAYFAMSKDFHPDRFYTRRTGSFAARLTAIFEGVTRAYQELGDGKGKGKARSAAAAANAQVEPQTPAEYAAELFARAMELEVHGNPLEAMKLFAATVRVDPQVKYLRRAASCALAAGQPRTAEEYANKAATADPTDGSVARLLASAFRAQGKLEAAEEVLVMAMAVPLENDKLALELRRELTEIRRLLAEQASADR